MDKKIKILGSSILTLGLVSCGNNQGTSSSLKPSTPESTPTSTPSITSSQSSEKEREDKTYFEWSWDNLNVGEDVPLTGIDVTDGGGYIASSKDDDGHVWIRQKEVLTGSMWGFCSSTVKDAKGDQIPLTDWSVEFTTRLPYEEADHPSDGGITFMASNLIGRYDLALYYSPSFPGTNSAANLWMAHAPDGLPKASTQIIEEWGDQGSKITNFGIYPGEEYKVTVAMKRTGKNERQEDVATMYVFFDDVLAIRKEGINYWQGGFGLRGYQSSWEYGNFKVGNFPKICPDGLDHFNDTTDPEAIELDTLATPVLNKEGRKVTWDAVPNADHYEVFNNYGNYVTTVTDCELDTSLYFSGKGTLKIQAANKKFGYLRSDAATIDYDLPNALIAPTLQVKNVTVLTWNQIVGASGYELFYEGEAFKTFSASQSEWDAVGYEGGFQIRALGDGELFLNSPLSNVVYPATPLLATPNLRYDGNKLYWDEDEDASSYELYQAGALIETLTVPYYETTTYGSYSVKALASDPTKHKNSELSNVFVIRQVDRTYFSKNFEGVTGGTVIDLSGEGWGIYYNDGRVWETKKEYKDGAMWIGVTDPYPRSMNPDVGKQWSATYFPATNAGAYLTSYCFEADLLLESEGPDGYEFFQHIFATQKTGGRYALDFKVYNTESKATIGLYDNYNCYAYVENVNFEYDVAHNVKVFYNLHSDKTARISVYLDTLCVFDESGLPAGIGDFGFSTISGNPMWTNIKVTDMPYYGPDGVDRY